jgi:hypothetical protein
MPVKGKRKADPAQGKDTRKKKWAPFPRLTEATLLWLAIDHRYRPTDPNATRTRTTRVRTASTPVGASMTVSPFVAIYLPRHDSAIGVDALNARFSADHPPRFLLHAIQTSSRR